MDKKLFSLLKEQIEKIEDLKGKERWGPEYQIWKNTTTKIVEDLFGKDYLELFKRSDLRAFSYIDDGYNQQEYLDELEEKKNF